MQNFRATLYFLVALFTMLYLAYYFLLMCPCTTTGTSFERPAVEHEELKAIVGIVHGAIAVWTLFFVVLEMYFYFKFNDYLKDESTGQLQHFWRSFEEGWLTSVILIVFVICWPIVAFVLRIIFWPLFYIFDAMSNQNGRIMHSGGMQPGMEDQGWFSRKTSELAQVPTSSLWAFLTRSRENAPPPGMTSTTRVVGGFNDEEMPAKEVNGPHGQGMDTMGNPMQPAQPNQYGKRVQSPATPSMNGLQRPSAFGVSQQQQQQQHPGAFGATPPSLSLGAPPAPVNSQHHPHFAAPTSVLTPITGGAVGGGLMKPRSILDDEFGTPATRMPGSQPGGPGALVAVNGAAFKEKEPADRKRDESDDSDDNHHRGSSRREKKSKKEKSRRRSSRRDESPTSGAEKSDKEGKEHKEKKENRSATAGGPVQKLSADNKSLTPVRGSEEGYCAAPGPHTTHLPFGTAPAGQLKPAADSRASHSGAASAGRDRRPLPARGGDDDDDGDNDSDDSNNNNNITTTNNNNNNNSNNVKGKSGNDNNADDADNVISNIGVRMGSRDKKNNANPISNTGGFNEGSGGAGSARSERFEKEEQPRRQRPAADEPAAAAPQGLADFVIDDDEDDDDDDDDTTHDAPLGTTPSTKSHSAGRGGPSPDNRPLTPDDDLSPAAPKPRRGGAAAAVKAVLRSTDDTSSGEGDTPLSPPLPAEEEDDPAAMSLSGRPAGGFSLARPAAKKARPKLGSGTPLSAADPSVAVAGFGGAGSTLLQASLRSKPSKSRLRKTFDDFSSNDEDSPPPAKEDPFGFKDISSDALAKIAGAKKADDDEFDF
ncbi:hypothetical protein DIPPA_01323 [Diplonema papillatum]|nr:hypothetical protein DIPPA_01323 [Diplonema papillatum]